MQLATEVHLCLQGHTEPLRVWRFGTPAQHTLVHGKRTLRMLQQEECAALPGWHAISTDGGALLQLDVPSAGTDGLADVWHLSALQVALPTSELYRRLAPTLFRAPVIPVAATSAQARPAAAQPTHICESECQVQLSFLTLTGTCVATARFPATIGARPLQPPPEEHRRVNLLLARVAPTARVESMASDFLPQAGIACCQVRQRGRVVMSAATHFSGALSSGARWSLGEAVYEDTSGVTQREQMEGRLSMGVVSVSGDGSAEASLRESLKPISSDVSVAGGDGGDSCAPAPAPLGDADDRIDHEETVGHTRALRWRLEGVELLLQVPWNAEEQGVVFRPHAAVDWPWTVGLKRLANYLA